jgi:hypothetical protein
MSHWPPWPGIIVMVAALALLEAFWLISKTGCFSQKSATVGEHRLLIELIVDAETPRRRRESLACLNIVVEDAQRL